MPARPPKYHTLVFLGGRIDPLNPPAPVATPGCVFAVTSRLVRLGSGIGSSAGCLVGGGALDKTDQGGQCTIIATVMNEADHLRGCWRALLCGKVTQRYVYKGVIARKPSSAKILEGAASLGLLTFAGLSKLHS